MRIGGVRDIGNRKFGDILRQLFLSGVRHGDLLRGRTIQQYPPSRRDEYLPVAFNPQADIVVMVRMPVRRFPDLLLT